MCCSRTSSTTKLRSAKSSLIRAWRTARSINAEIVLTDLRIHMRSRLRLVKASPITNARSGPVLRPLYSTDWLLIFCVAFVGILIPHLPLLTLPYFWDEAGYYIPAARDLLLTGSLIPHTTLSNAHPPLVMAWLALWWKLAGFAPVVTRCAMLMIAAAAMAGVYRMAPAH